MPSRWVSCPGCQVHFQTEATGTVHCAACKNLFAQATAAVPSMSWFIVKNKQKVGPLSLDQMRQLSRSGQLRPEDMVLQEGTRTWTPARKVFGLIVETPLPLASKALPTAVPFSAGGTPVTPGANTATPDGPRPAPPMLKPRGQPRKLHWILLPLAGAACIVVAALLLKDGKEGNETVRDKEAKLRVADEPGKEKEKKQEGEEKPIVSARDYDACRVGDVVVTSGKAFTEDDRVDVLVMFRNIFDDDRHLVVLHCKGKVNKPIIGMTIVTGTIYMKGTRGGNPTLFLENCTFSKP